MAEAQAIWDDLFKLMSSSAQYGGVDFTIFFRSLGDAPVQTAPTHPSAPATEASAADSDEPLPNAVRLAALSPVEEWPAEHRAQWNSWARRYWQRVTDEAQPAKTRQASMAQANPKYILRNWMATEAHEAAERGDFTIVQQIHKVLSSPYEEQDAATALRWCQLTPQWARGRLGIEFMS